ncbi:NACHT domain-containing protein [Streptomyces sp. NPDC088816]|uniref:NACHT domain-containing protein n=1 Tax=Streptomyces sp. NPDC088816 TaxID=3365906 RepID=UPI00380093D5
MGKPEQQPHLSVTSSSISGHNIQIGTAGDINITIQDCGNGQFLVTHMKREEAAQLISQELDARRKVLRSVPGLSDDQVTASFSIEPALPDALISPRIGTFTLLSGPLGSGKSDMAARWLLDRVRDFRSGESTAWPLWINSRDVRLSLESEIVNRIGIDALQKLGASIVIDGIDERLTNTASLVEECELFVAKWKNCQILGTSRPDVISPSNRTVYAEAWDEGAAADLIRKVSGANNIYPTMWPTRMQEIIKRPLFALLVGSAYFSNGSTPHTTTALLDACVTHSLTRRTKGWEDAAPILRKLAVALIDKNRPIKLVEVGGEERRLPLLQTRFISIEGGNVKFSLPVFEQWFAAQALLMGEVPLKQAIKDLGTFVRWRYVLAFAVSAGSERQSANILQELAAWNVGAAGWLVKESVANSLRSFNEEKAELPSWREVGESIHETASAWCSALGESAPLAFPVDAGQSIEKDWTLGVAVEEDGHTISYTWERRGRIDSPVAHIMNFPESKGSIFPYSFSRISGDHNWVWDWTRNHARDNLAKNLARWIHLNCPSGGIVEKEYIWSLVCAIMGGSRMNTISFEKGEILARVEQVKENVKAVAGSVDDFAINFSGKQVTRLDLALLREYLSSQEIDRVAPLWPKLDIPQPQGGWVWDFYSPERLTELVSAVYGGALKAYLEISQNMFSRFGHSLGHAAVMPAKLTGKVFVSSERRAHPVLSYRFFPNPNVDFAENSVDIMLAEEHVERAPWEDLSYRKQLDRYFLDNPDRSAFPIYSWSQTAFDVWGTRPATKIAAGWIWRDLSTLGWLPQNRPHDVLSVK